MATCILVWTLTTFILASRWMNDSDYANNVSDVVNENLLKMPDIDDKGADIFDPTETVMDLEVSVGRHDRSHQYLIYDHVVLGSQFLALSHSLGVTLCTLSSMDRLFWLVDSSRLWDGPLSVAVFISGHEFDIVRTYISYLRSCFQHIRTKVSFSLSHPINSIPFSTSDFSTTDLLLTCADPRAALMKLLSLSKPGPINLEFPQNHLRNIARANSLTYYTMSLDVDILPSTGMAKPLAMFLNRNTCAKCAFVIPTYEIDNKVEFPSNKSELVNLVKKLQARPYHSKVFIHNQFATNFSSWVIFSIVLD